MVQRESAVQTLRQTLALPTVSSQMRPPTQLSAYVVMSTVQGCPSVTVPLAAHAPPWKPGTHFCPVGQPVCAQT